MPIVRAKPGKVCLETTAFFFLKGQTSDGVGPQYQGYQEEVRKMFLEIEMSLSNEP